MITDTDDDYTLYGPRKPRTPLVPPETVAQIKREVFAFVVMLLFLAIQFGPMFLAGEVLRHLGRDSYTAGVIVGALGMVWLRWAMHLRFGKHGR